MLRGATSEEGLEVCPEALWAHLFPYLLLGKLVGVECLPLRVHVA